MMILLQAKSSVHDSVEKETFKTTYLSSRIRRAVQANILHIRPSGRYAKKNVRSSYANLRQGI